MKLFTLIFSLYATIGYAQQIDSLLCVLDEVVAQSEIYEKERIERINSIRNWLSDATLTNEVRYELNRKMYCEYESYVCDSAWRYANENILLSKKIGAQQHVHEAMLMKAHVLATGGLFDESEKILANLNVVELETAELKARFYKCLSDCYLYRAESNVGNEFFTLYEQTSRVYSDSALMYASDSSYLYAITKAPELAKQGKIDESVALIRAKLTKYEPNTHEAAMLHSLWSFANYCDGDSVAQLEHLIYSAMADIRGVVTENRALREVAEILFAVGDLERANIYLKKSLADATKFNSRLRNVQSSCLLPMVDAAYQQMQDEQHAKILLYLWFISILTILLIVLVLFVYRQMKNKARANQMLSNLNSELQRLNVNLKESNDIKEEYVGQFMQLCTTYISEFDMYRKRLHKASLQTKLSEFQRMLSSDEQVDMIAKNFYTMFDQSFIKLFPNFVSRVNELFPKGDELVLKSDGKFNTELRILSLIRLGITDSEKMANFLRCSITTIYTYRSKMKNRALQPEQFEANVMKIEVA